MSCSSTRYRDFEDKELETFGIQATVPYVKTHAWMLGLSVAMLGLFCWSLGRCIVDDALKRRAYEQILAYRSSGLTTNRRDVPSRILCRNCRSVRTAAAAFAYTPRSRFYFSDRSATRSFWLHSHESLGLFGILDPIVVPGFRLTFFVTSLPLASRLDRCCFSCWRAKYFARSVTAVVGSLCRAGFHRLLHKLPRQTAYLFSPLPNARTIRAWLATAIAVVGLVAWRFMGASMANAWFEISPKRRLLRPAQLAPFSSAAWIRSFYPLIWIDCLKLRLLVAAGIALLLLIAMTTIVDLKSKRKKLKRILGKQLGCELGALLLAGDVVIWP